MLGSKKRQQLISDVEIGRGWGRGIKAIPWIAHRNLNKYYLQQGMI